MCGICGIVSLAGEAVDPAVVEAMNEMLVRRGPDSAGTFAEGAVDRAAHPHARVNLDQTLGRVPACL